MCYLYLLKFYDTTNFHFLLRRTTINTITKYNNNLLCRNNCYFRCCYHLLQPCLYRQTTFLLEAIYLAKTWHLQDKNGKIQVCWDIINYLLVLFSLHSRLLTRQEKYCQNLQKTTYLLTESGAFTLLKIPMNVQKISL